MDWTTLIGLLAFVTLTSWIGIAYLNKHKVEQRKKDPRAPKSALAADAPSNSKAALRYDTAY